MALYSPINEKSSSLLLLHLMLSLKQKCNAKVRVAVYVVVICHHEGGEGGNKKRNTGRGERGHTKTYEGGSSISGSRKMGQLIRLCHLACQNK